MATNLKETIRKMYLELLTNNQNDSVPLAENLSHMNLEDDVQEFA